LASATRGVEDAIENWWHMEMLLDEIRSELAEAHRIINEWERDYARLARRLHIQPYVMAGHGIGFAVGGTFLGMGLYGLVNNSYTSSDQNNLTTGAAIIGTTALVYILGRYIFKWW